MRVLNVGAGLQQQIGKMDVKLSIVATLKGTDSGSRQYLVEVMFCWFVLLQVIRSVSGVLHGTTLARCWLHVEGTKQYPCAC